MDCNIGKVKILDSDINKYLDNLVNRIFAVLGIYEECVLDDKFDNYISYLDRVIVEISGVANTFKMNDFIGIVNILVGLQDLNILNHKKVKSLTFHCIDVVKKNKIR